MKTALQELKEFLPFDFENLDNSDETINVAEIKRKINELLQDEKTQIENAYNQGYRDGFNDSDSCINLDKDISDFDDAENYFNDIFNN